MYNTKMQHQIQYKTFVRKGLKQLKGFVDDRTKFKKEGLLSATIQRATFEKWIEDVKKDPNAPITLYTHILSDGLGDAGQLGYLVDKVKTLRTNVIPYATSEFDEEKKEDLKKLSRIDDNQHLKCKNNSHAGWIDECDSSWEIQYPVPANVEDKNRNNDKILRITEMGQISTYTRYYKDLYSNGLAFVDAGVPIGGYGIPRYQCQVEDRSKMLEIISGEDLQLLKDAFLIKINTYSTNKEMQNQYIENILSICATKSPSLIILLGVDKLDLEVASKSGDISSKIRCLKSLEQNVLSCLMSQIGLGDGKGMIFAGGEGMYVQALGASDAAVGILPRDAYTYQINQIIADSRTLFPKSPLTLPQAPYHLGMMKLEQMNLKAYSDAIRGHNWFDKLDSLKPASVGQ